MFVYQLEETGGFDKLRRVEKPAPVPGPHDVVVAMRAWSLNYRDLAMPLGGYIRNDKITHSPPLVPLSDGAGEVIAVGSSVSRFAVGDRVAASFFTDWIDGELESDQIGSALGGAIDGMLAEQVCLAEHAWVRIPRHYNFAEAATLPCAAVTAWQALHAAGLKQGDVILLLGTGGVSIFGLQLARAAGARTIITSSSDAKLERARDVGADDGINYRKHNEWQHEVRRVTEGIGVENVLEVGGAGTLAQSLASARVSGTVSLIGVLTGTAADHPSVMPALFNRLTIRGIYVGSRRMFEDLVRSIEVTRLKSVIDRRFPIDQTRAAYEYLQSGAHFGKVVIEAS